MRSLFEERFEEELRKIAQAIGRKGGIKRADKVYQRIGRARQRYPSVQYYYDIEVELNKDKTTALSIQWEKNEQRYGLVTN